MKTQVEKILLNVINDFNSKWTSHAEKDAGVSEYAEQIVKLFSQADVKLSLPEQYKEGAKWGYAEGFKAALKSLNDMLPIIESKMNEGNGA